MRDDRSEALARTEAHRAMTARAKSEVAAA